MEVASGYCKLLPVFGKKQLEKERFHCHADARAGLQSGRPITRGVSAGRQEVSSDRKRTFLSSLFLHTPFVSVVWRQELFVEPLRGSGFFLTAGSSASSPQVRPP